jgi:hypothetical protein
LLSSSRPKVFVAEEDEAGSDSRPFDQLLQPVLEIFQLSEAFRTSVKASGHAT